MTHRAWAEVDLRAIRNNINVIRSYVGLRVDVMAVVKADAYGHGAVEVARAAVEAGAEALGTATVAEAVEIRAVLPGATIFVLSPFDYREAEAIVVNRLTPFIGDLEAARSLSRTAYRLRAGVRAHLDIDTGMGRTGFLYDAAGKAAEVISRLPGILITGIATHFAAADDDPEFTAAQLDWFRQARAAVEATDTPINHAHCAASAGVIRYPGARFNMVRPGLLIYGLLPPLDGVAAAPELRPALTLKTRIAALRSLPAGHTISYGHTHTLARESRIATLPVGYGDGYPRALSNRGHVLVRGRRIPIVGRVCMDMTLVDVTDVPGAMVDDEVVLIGSQGNLRINAEEISILVGTTEHDVTTRLTRRVYRQYM